MAGTFWLLSATALTVTVSAAAAPATRCPAGPACPMDTARLTLTATPRRPAMLAAKTEVLTGLVPAPGIIAVAGPVLPGRLVLPGRGFPPLSPGDGPVLRAVADSVLNLALIALLSLDIAALLRDSAAATGVVLGLLCLPELIAAVLAGNPQWQHRIERYAPMSAGLTIQDATGLHNLPTAHGPASASWPSGPQSRCSPAA